MRFWHFVISHTELFLEIVTVYLGGRQPVCFRDDHNNANIALMLVPTFVLPFDFDDFIGPVISFKHYPNQVQPFVLVSVRA